MEGEKKRMSMTGECWPITQRKAMRAATPKHACTGNASCHYNQQTEHKSRNKKNPVVAESKINYHEQMQITRAALLALLVAGTGRWP